jgi:two-component system heavy metal sensor histidine kinase CusS
MTGPDGADRSWSLTQRLGRQFALMTSALIAVYALGSTYALYSTMRAELNDFIWHELEEFELNVDSTDGSQQAVQDATTEIAMLSEALPCAFRVRDRSGWVVAESGPEHLLATSVDATPDPPDHVVMPLVGSPVVVRTAASHRHELLLELIVDTSEKQAKLVEYLAWSGGAFLASVLLAGLCGWYTAWRGLRGLRAMVTQTRGIDLASESATILLDRAPRELSELGNELNAMLARIEQGLVSMRTFTAGLAHELRSPLQNLIGETEVSLMAERSGDDYRHLLRSNLDDLHSLSDAVDNLIAWCRSAEPKRRGAPLEDFDLAVEAHLRLERERRSAERAGVLLKLESDGDTRLFANREDSLRVLRNLVGNAITWSPRDREVVVHIHGDPDGVRLSVEDRGPGIPESLADRIFEPFVTGHARRGARGGYGLGLAICRSIMLEHGGQIAFEPRADGGTRFVADFPRRGSRAA